MTSVASAPDQMKTARSATPARARLAGRARPAGPGEGLDDFADDPEFLEKLMHTGHLEMTHSPLEYLYAQFTRYIEDTRSVPG